MVEKPSTVSQKLVYFVVFAWRNEYLKTRRINHDHFSRILHKTKVFCYKLISFTLLWLNGWKASIHFDEVEISNCHSQKGISACNWWKKRRMLRVIKPSSGVELYLCFVFFLVLPHAFWKIVHEREVWFSCGCGVPLIVWYKIFRKFCGPIIFQNIN